MIEHAYLKWMSENTESDWCNDSAMNDEIDAAIESRAIGCTSNPPLTYQVLSERAADYSAELSLLPAGIEGDEKVVELIGMVVRRISNKLKPIYRKSGETRGYIRAQVQPDASEDFEAMLSMGKTFASWAENIKVKIPGTAAGIDVLEELAALGIPTNPTVCVSVSQMIATAEANERGIERAKKAGIGPGHSTSAFVLGRLQDYLTVLNDERGAGLSFYDLESAVLAAAKRCCQIFSERGFNQLIMPAAFRSARQVAELAGSKTVMTIHPSIQKKIIKADENGEISREIAIDRPVDPDAVDRVLLALPEFEQAYEDGGLSKRDFDSYGATSMTLSSFNETGWQKLRRLELPS